MPATPMSGARIVRVGNLPFSASAPDLHELVVQRTGVTPFRVSLVVGSQGPKGFGFVEMDSAEDARRVAELLSKLEFGGRKLRTKLGPSPLRGCREPLRFRQRPS